MTVPPVQPAQPMPRIRTPGGRDPGVAPTTPPVDPAHPAPPPPLQPVAPTPTVITAAPDPGMTDVAGMTRDYIKGIPGAAGDVMDTAGGKIRDSYEGVYKSNDHSSARRGVLDTGVAGARNDRTTDELTQALAGSATNIAEAAHRDAGQQLSNLAAQEAARLAGQQAQQRVSLDAHRADIEQERAYQDQLEALTGLYSRPQPRSYYDDTDPRTTPVNPGGGAGGGATDRDQFGVARRHF